MDDLIKKLRLTFDTYLCVNEEKQKRIVKYACMHYEITTKQFFKLLDQYKSVSNK